MHNSKRIIDVHILESISEDRTRVAQYFIYTFIIEYHPNDFIAFYIFFFSRNIFISAKCLFPEVIDSLSIASVE